MADKQAALQFLRAIGPGPYVFQTLNDNDTANENLVRVFTGSFEDVFETLEMYEQQGAGIFVQINKGPTRKGKDIVRVRALFVDIDGRDVTSDKVLNHIQGFMPPPSIVVSSSPGKYHIYWRVKDCPVTAFSNIQKNLAITFATDPAVSDLPRVMRVPGFLHQKDPDNKHLVTAAFTPDKVYGVDQLVSCAREAPVLTPTGLPQVDPHTGKSNDVFGLHVKEAPFKEPTVLKSPGRTNALVSWIGHLVECGYGKEWIKARIQKANVELCDPSIEPLPRHKLEREVLPAIDTFMNRAAAEAAPLQAPPPPTEPVKVNPKVPPPPTIEIQPDVNPTNLRALEVWEKRFVFVIHGSKVADSASMGEFAIFDLADFKNAMFNVVTQSGTPMFNKWFKSRNRKNVQSTIYYPNGKQIIFHDGVKKFNTYRKPALLPVTGQYYKYEYIEPFDKHLRTVFAEGNAYEIFTKWMAVTVRKPEIRIPWAPFLISPQGGGKGFIFMVLARLVGESNANLILADRLDNQFNSFLGESTLVCVDELGATLKSNAHAKLKSMITERRMELNSKGQKERNQDIFANFIIFANKADGKLIEKDDRRFWVYRWKQVESAQYFADLFRWADFAYDGERNMRHLLSWIESIDISDFKYNICPPKTQAKQELIRLSQTDIDAIIEDSFEYREGPFQAAIVAFPTICNYVEQRVGRPLDRNDLLKLKHCWAEISAPLPDNVSRVSIPNSTFKRARVRCARDHKYWKHASKDDITFEATRAEQMVMTPDNVDPPRLVTSNT